jgi:hypothetical protein
LLLGLTLDKGTWSRTARKRDKNTTRTVSLQLFVKCLLSLPGFQAFPDIVDLACFTV